MRHLNLRAAIAVLTTAFAVAACDTSTPTASGPSAVTGIGVSGGNVQVGAAGTALPQPLMVHVTDQYGAGFAGATVTLSTSGGATTPLSSLTTDANGNASTTATLGLLAGIDSITASVSGATVPARFLETAIAGPPAVDSVASGNQQSGTTGTVLPIGLAVVVLDSHGNPVVRDTVTWAATTGTLSATTTVTDATGTATVQFTPALGANSVTASIGGSTLVANFTETGN